jgi:hypothetical protein
MHLTNLLHYLRQSQTAATGNCEVARRLLRFLSLAFAGIGVLYFQHWVIGPDYLVCWRRPFPARLAPTRAYAAGASTRLNMDSMSHAAVMIIQGFLHRQTGGLAATAIATGEKVVNRAVTRSMPTGKRSSIIESSAEYGRARDS